MMVTFIALSFRNDLKTATALCTFLHTFSLIVTQIQYFLCLSRTTERHSDAILVQFIIKLIRAEGNKELKGHEA